MNEAIVDRLEPGPRVANLNAYQYPKDWNRSSARQQSYEDRAVLQDLFIFYFFKVTK